MKKIKPNDPAYPENWDSRYEENISLAPGPSIRTKAIFDCVAALLSNSQYVVATKAELIKEAIRTVDLTIEILNKRIESEEK